MSSIWGYRYTAGSRIDAETHEVKDLGVDHLETQYRQTTDLLGPYLKLYQIHSATLPVLDDQSVLARLAEIRGTGIAIGLRISGPQQAATIRRAVEIDVAGERLFWCKRPGTSSSLQQARHSAKRMRQDSA